MDGERPSNTTFSANKSADTIQRERSKRARRQVFTAVEDSLLTQLVRQVGENQWAFIASYIPGRTVRQCKERYFTYLCPAVRSESWTDVEDALILQKVNEIGHHWTRFVRFFDGRTPNALKNRWNFLVKDSQQAKKKSAQQSTDGELRDGRVRYLFPPVSSLPFLDGPSQPESRRMPLSNFICTSEKGI
jgi:hypothetical protein